MRLSPTRAVLAARIEAALKSLAATGAIKGVPGQARQLIGDAADTLIGEAGSHPTITPPRSKRGIESAHPALRREAGWAGRVVHG